MYDLKIMTWNIKGEASLEWNNRYEIKSKLVDKIIEQQADVIVLTAFVIAKGVEYLFDRLQNEEYIWFQQSCSGKNGVFIAIRKILVNDKEFINYVYNTNLISSHTKGCNILVVTLPLKCKKKISIVGCRMETGHKEDLREQYDFQKECFDELLIPEINKAQDSDVCILCGDFNNAKHYGELGKSFEEVKTQYMKREWNETKRQYEGPFLPVAQYNYNLHRIKDSLSIIGFQLCENKNDWTFQDKYENKIHEDHIFVKGLTYKSSDIIKEKNLSDHNILWAEVKLED